MGLNFDDCVICYQNNGKGAFTGTLKNFCFACFKVQFNYDLRVPESHVTFRSNYSNYCCLCKDEHKITLEMYICNGHANEEEEK